MDSDLHRGRLAHRVVALGHLDVAEFAPRVADQIVRGYRGVEAEEAGGDLSDDGYYVKQPGDQPGPEQDRDAVHPRGGVSARGQDGPKLAERERRTDLVGLGEGRDRRGDDVRRQKPERERQ